MRTAVNCWKICYVVKYSPMIHAIASHATGIFTLFSLPHLEVHSRTVNRCFWGIRFLGFFLEQNLLICCCSAFIQTWRAAILQCSQSAPLIAVTILCCLSFPCFILGLVGSEHRIFEDPSQWRARHSRLFYNVLLSLSGQGSMLTRLEWVYKCCWKEAGARLLFCHAVYFGAW